MLIRVILASETKQSRTFQPLEPSLIAWKIGATQSQSVVYKDPPYPHTPDLCHANIKNKWNPKFSRKRHTFCASCCPTRSIDLEVLHRVLNLFFLSRSFSCKNVCINPSRTQGTPEKAVGFFSTAVSSSWPETSRNRDALPASPYAGEDVGTACKQCSGHNI